MIKPEVYFILIGLFLLLLTGLSKLFSKFFPNARLKVFLAASITCLLCYFSINHITKPRSNYLNSEKYQLLIENLEMAYNHVSGNEGFMFLNQPPPDELGKVMKELNISCLLYVHDEQKSSYQKGILLKGKPSWFVSATRAYRISEPSRGQYKLNDWPDTERAQGPDIYFVYSSFLDGKKPYCQRST